MRRVFKFIRHKDIVVHFICAGLLVFFDSPPLRVIIPISIGAAQVLDLANLNRPLRLFNIFSLLRVASLVLFGVFVVLTNEPLKALVTGLLAVTCAIL
jgi:hypothetical protein